MKRCKICVLPETFPGIHFNDEGICQYCQKFKGQTLLKERKQKFKKRFEDLIKKYKGQGTYDALMSYSGGKDSTYVLYLLRQEYGLNVFAVTFDNGFLPEQTRKNIQQVAESLGFDHIFFKPRFDILKKIFTASSMNSLYPSQALTRASTICTSCITIVKFTSLRLAVEMHIPFIVFGWSPGQIPISSSIMKNNPRMIEMRQKSLYDPLHRLVGEGIRPYFLEEKHLKGDYFFPYNISPLSFLDYDEKEIMKEMSRLGWTRPEDVDVHSTNCLLNSLANDVHRKQFGFHPYVFELAKLVREGYLSRSEALHKLDRAESQKTIKMVRKKLGLQDS